MTGDAVATGVLFAFAACALFWLSGIALNRAKSKPRSRERALLLFFAVALVAAVKWFWP